MRVEWNYGGNRMEIEWKYSGSMNCDGNTSEGNGPYKPPYGPDHPTKS